MICASAGPLGRTVRYPEWWNGLITTGGCDLTIPVRWVAEVQDRWPSLNARVVGGSWVE